MPPTTVQRQAIDQLQEFTGISERTASRMLKNHGWNLEQALDAHYAQTGMTPPSRNSGGLVKLFDSFRDPVNDSPDSFGIGGILKYFEQLGVNPEHVSALVALEITQAGGMEEITKKGFVDGWLANGGADTISKQKQHIADQTKSLQNYPAYFKKVYRWTFAFAKENSQKALTLETAMIYWNVLFSSPGPSLQTSSINWLDEWTGYLQEKWNKSVNKDMWNQTLEFFTKALADESLSFWSEDGAWPGVIDDFVAHVKEKRGESPEKMEVD